MTREGLDSAGSTQLTSDQMTREEIVAFFDRRQEAVDDLDAAVVAANYTEDCVVESPAVGTLRGPAEVEKASRAWFEAFPDLKLRSESLVIDGNRAVQVAMLEGTDIGGFMGLPPTGKMFRVPVVLICEFKGGRIVRERRIYDFTSVLVQIGVLKAKPV